MKMYAILAVILTFLGFQPAEAKPIEAGLVIRKIVCPIDQERAWVGTGFLVGPNTLVTAAHVAAGRLCFVDGEPIQNIYVNTARDIAVARTLTTAEHWLPLSCRSPHRGDVVAVWGHPNGGRLEKRVFAASGGPVTNSQPQFNGLELFDGAATGGQSGSPILFHNKVIGVLTAGNEAQMFGRLLRDTYMCGSN